MCLSIFNLLAFLGPSALRGLRVAFTLFHALLHQFSPSCIGSSVLVPVFTGHTRTSPFRSTLLAMSCPPKCDLRLSSLCLGSSSQPPWSFTLPLYLHIFAASSASRTPTLVCLFTKVDFSFGFGFILQCCINLSSFLLDRTRSHLCYKSSIHHRSFICKLFCFLIAFRDELFEEQHLLRFLLCAVRFFACSPSTSTPS